MKKFFKCLLVLGLFFSLSNQSVQAKEEPTKAVWISYLDFQEKLKDKTEAQFRSAFDEMCKNTVNSHLNTVIVHVRAFQDAIYPSKSYPTASWISSDQRDLSYDPLEIMVQIAHDYNLKFEAWLNPYRVSLSSSDTDRFIGSKYIEQFDVNNDLIAYNSGSDRRMILNPASSRVVDFIVDGVEEIVKNYDVDGIHFDDYFYQNGTFGNTSVQERKNHVNALVRNVYEAIKAIDSSVVFGVSPSGNLDNARHEGADIDRWLSSEGFMDYLMPQIYWTDQFGSDGMTTMFSNRLKLWMDLWTNKEVDLMVGLGLYMVERKPAGDIGWSWGGNNIATQIKQCDENGIMGFALFRYGDLLKSVAATEINNMKTYLSNNSGMLPTNPENPGPAIRTGWYQVDSKWFYNDDLGKAFTGWVAAGEYWYYVDQGKMLEYSWIAQDHTGAVWFYVGNEGKMVTSTTVDGYAIDWNGYCFM